MGYIEAVKDGIRISGNDATDNWYYPKCHICGIEVPNWNYKHDVKYTCKECKIKIYLSDREAKTENNTDLKKKKIENAINRIGKVTNISEYRRAIEVITDKLHRPGWFESTEEIMVAIELVKNKIKARHQVKFGRYRADFVLPEEKIILEIDGILFHTERTMEKEILRDNLMLLSVGVEWEVIRITDKLVNENITMLIPAIRGIKKERQDLREKNDGMLPAWYSNREINKIKKARKL